MEHLRLVQYLSLFREHNIALYAQSTISLVLQYKSVELVSLSNFCKGLYLEGGSFHVPFPFITLARRAALPRNWLLRSHLLTMFFMSPSVLLSQYKGRRVLYVQNILQYYINMSYLKMFLKPY